MDRTKLIDDLTLMLIDLTSWEEDRPSARYAWKGYDFDTLDYLEDEGFVSFSWKAKSLRYTEAGQERAEELFAEYGIQVDPIPSAQPFFRFRVRFAFETLTCVRTLLVPEHTTFEDFHTMIQACLNWMNYHLYDFRVKSGGKDLRISWPDYETGGDPRSDFLGSETDGTWVNSAEIYLDEVFPRAKNAVYSYDYGDGWEMEISLINLHEKIASANPICWDGSGDAPPEDVGGEGGFEHFLKVVEDENDPDCEHMRAWGEGQGFERFSKNKVNRRFAHWRDWARKDDSLSAAASKGAPEDSESEEPDYDVEYSRIKADNERYLDTFDEWLGAKGLKRATINKHLSNVEFYLNTYLAGRMLEPMAHGIALLDGYLGDWFLRKCMWSSPATIKGTAASVKKFYRCMADMGIVGEKDYAYLVALVKEMTPEWIAALEDWESGASWF